MLTTVTAYGSGAASTRVRVFDWINHFGIEGRASTYLGSANNSARQLLADPPALARAEANLRSLSNVVAADHVLLSRRASPFSNGGIEQRLLRNAARGIYDFDDALMFSPDDWKERIWSKRRTWNIAVEAADVVIAGNEYLAERAADLNANTIIVPSCVDPGKLQAKSSYELSDTPRAVWVGSPATEMYLATISAPLLRLHESHGLRISVVSSGSATLGKLDRMVDRIPWSLASANAARGSADFGIMPLPDNKWTRGKCAYKLLEYGGAGLPLIGSPIGANARVLALSSGLAPASEDDWSDAMLHLLSESASARRSRGVAAREAVAEHYSFQAWASRWANAVGVTPEGHTR